MPAGEQLQIRKRRSASFHMKKHSGKTIVDIGNAVGVSHSTVSRALRNDPRISPETTRKVIQAAYALGYVQNARPDQPVIGLFLPVKQLDCHVLCSLSAIATEILRRNWRFEILPSSRPNLNPVHFLSGAINIHAPDETIRMWTLNSIHPLVTYTKRRPLQTGIYPVAEDGFYDMELCVRYLSGLGHRRIGLLMNHSRQEEEASMEQRYQGFLRAMKPCRLEKPESYVGFNSDGTLSENLDRLLAKEITALIVLPGDFCLSVYGELLHRNFRMPSDISLLSWSFPGVLENLYPRITVLEQNYKQWAEVSCDLLEKKWRGEEVRTPLFVRGKLLKRDSCGPVPCR